MDRNPTKISHQKCQNPTYIGGQNLNYGGGGGGGGGTVPYMKMWIKRA